MTDNDGSRPPRARTVRPMPRGTNQAATVADPPAVPPSERVLAQLTHELRAPVQAILWTLEQLQDQQAQLDPARLNEGLASIQHAARRMSHLVDDLTDTELIRSGCLVLRRTAARLEALVDEALEHLRSAAAQKRLQVYFVASPERASVTCDEERILRLLVNLLGNAIQFTPTEGEIVIRSWASASEVGVEIRDSGPDLAERIRRCRREASLGANGAPRSGLGLGMFIARSVATAHGGRLWVDNSMGHGATFAFALPRGLAH